MPRIRHERSTCDFSHDRRVSSFARLDGSFGANDPSQDSTSHLSGHAPIATTSRLGQISHGVETVSTNAVSRHWDFTRFTVADR